MTSVNQRRFCEADLEGKTKHDLADIIRGQMHHWPAEINFSESKLKKEVLQSAILDNGFTIPGTPPTASVDPTTPQVLSGSIRLPTPPAPVSSRQPTPPAPLEHRSLDLLIEDIREQPVNKFIQTLVLSSTGDLPTGGWTVNTTELLKALQESPSALDGAVKLAVTDPINNGWKRYFVKVLGSQSLQDASPSPVQLEIPADSRLKIIVEDSLPPVNHRKRERSPSVSDHKPHAPESSKGSLPPKKRTSQAEPKDVSWLKDSLLKRSGYSSFTENHKKKLTNQDRVVFWKFAAEFSTEYFNKPSGATENLGKPLKKASVEAALDMGATALAEAEKMTRILNKFTAPEVTDRAAQETIEGRSFIDFLTQWDKSHLS
ncbi:hypothetical protein C8R43DRAFT_1148203 [Mycena crocata]|nr:hypothetical protein C8R43DRAFT_1148203 [Mycena crocata]